MVNSFCHFACWPRWLDIKGACAYLSMSRKTLMGYVHNGDIYAKKLNGKWHIDRVSIDRFMLSSDDVNNHLEKLKIMEGIL